MKTIKILLLSFLFAIAQNSHSMPLLPGVSYEMKSATVVGAPIENLDGISRTWYLNVVSNIVGNPYAQFYHTDVIKFTFLKTDSQDIIQQKMIKAAQDFVVNTYK